MKKNPIYQALSIILRNTGRSLQILKYGLIEHGWLRVTDLEHELKVFVGDQRKQPVLVDVGLFIKTGDLQASIGAAQSLDAKEFPGEISTGQQEVEIPPKVLHGLSELLPAASADDSRGVLKCVFVNRKKRGEAVATDGHFLLLKKLDTALKESFLIDAISLKISSLFVDNITRCTVSHKVTDKDAAGRGASDLTYLIISGDGWQLVSKVPEATEYPSYRKAIPDRSNAVAVPWDNVLKAEVDAFLEKSKAFTNPKSHLVHLTAKEGIVRNRELSYLRKTDFSKDILALKPEQVIGLDAELLYAVLRYIGNRPVSVTVGETMVNPVVFHGENFLALIMPLKTGESGAGITRAELLKEEGGKTAAILALENQMKKAA
jgi:hypothetical protein